MVNIKFDIQLFAAALTLKITDAATGAVDVVDTTDLDLTSADSNDDLYIVSNDTTAVDLTAANASATLKAQTAAEATADAAHASLKIGDITVEGTGTSKVITVELNATTLVNNKISVAKGGDFATQNTGRLVVKSSASQEITFLDLGHASTADSTATSLTLASDGSVYAATGLKLTSTGSVGVVFKNSETAVEATLTNTSVNNKTVSVKGTGTVAPDTGLITDVAASSEITTTVVATTDGSTSVTTDALNNNEWVKVNGVYFEATSTDGTLEIGSTNGSNAVLIDGTVAIDAETATDGIDNKNTFVYVGGAVKEISLTSGSATVTEAGVIGSVTNGSDIKTEVYGTDGTANVSMASTALNESITVNGVTFKSANTDTMTVVARSASSATLVTGTITLDSSNAKAAVINGGTAAATDAKVTYSGTGDVTVTAAGVVSGLGKDETVSVVIGDTTTTYAVKDGILTVSDGTKSSKYSVVDTSSDVSFNVKSDIGSYQSFTNVTTYSVPPTYTKLSSNNKGEFAALEITGKQIFNNTGNSSATDIYATLTRDASQVYTFTTESNISALTGVTFDLSKLSSNAAVKVTDGTANGTNYIGAEATYKTTGGATFTTKDYSFTITGDTLTNISGEGTNDGITLTGGTVTLGDANASTVVTTTAGKLTINVPTASTAKVSSAGAVTGLITGGSVALAENKDADESATSSISVNGKSFEAVSTKGATIAYDGEKYELTVGSLAVPAGSTQYFDLNGGNANTTSGNAKVTGGNGVILTESGLVSGLEEGESVDITLTSGAKYVYTVTSGVLEVAYTAVGSTTAATTYYNLNGSSISFTALDTPTESECDAPTTVAVGLTNTTTANSVTQISDKGTLYVKNDGTTSLSDSKAVASITLSNDTVSYTATSGAKAQTVYVSNATANNAVNWNITTTGNADTVQYDATSDATISSGAGKDTIRVNATGSAVVTVNSGEGNDTITLSNTAGTTASVDAGAGNDEITVNGVANADYYVDGGDGNNTLTHATTAGNVTLKGGTGKDTITAGGADDSIVGGDGADTFVVTNRSMTISDYTYGADVLRTTATSGTITVNPTSFGGDGVVSVASGVTADVSAGTSTGDYYAVSLVDGTGKNKQNVAWAKDGGSTIDISTYDQAVTLIGNADGKNALYAGTKADNIYSYAENDSVYGGEGKDYISLASGVTGRVVGVATTGGKDTVDGFKAGFEEGDSIFMIDGSASVVKTSFANNTVTFKDGDGSLQLNGVSASSTTGAVELNVSGTKVALAAASVGGAIAADSTSYADVYMGNNAALYFTAAEGAVNVDLRNDLASGAEGAKYSGITAVTGGAGNNTLIGAAAGESLTAGTGASSLWGGAGKDTLVGGSASDVFYIGTGDGSDVVTNFSAAGNENADTVYTFSNITAAKLTNNGVEISVGDTDKITLQNVKADTAIKFNAGGNAGVAKVGSATDANNFTYDSTVTYYGGGNKSDKIAFASGSTEDAQVWLDGSQGKSYASIDVVDGTNAGGSLIVAGDSASQSIIGGKGDTSLWGGAGSATDTLKSSASGKTMFWWGAGDGNDVVVSASADDSVNLYNVKLSDINSANSSITNSGVVLALNDGSKLTMQTSRGMTFSIEGQSWTADQSSKEWKQNS